MSERLSDIEKLILEADSLCSLIYYRESAHLSDQSRRELGQLVASLRVAARDLYALAASPVVSLPPEQQ